MPVPNEPKAPNPFAGAITGGEGAVELNDAEANALGGVPGGESFITSIPPEPPAVVEELNALLCTPNAEGPGCPNVLWACGTELPNTEELPKGAGDDDGTDPNADGCEPPGGLDPKESDENTEVGSCSLPNPPKEEVAAGALGTPNTLVGLD